MTYPTIESKFVTGKKLDKLGAEFKGKLGDLFRYVLGNKKYLLQLCTGNKTERYKVLEMEK